MNQLSSKAYWDNIKSISPQMVIMYLPADHFLSEASKLDPDIQQDAMKKNVLIEVNHMWDRIQVLMDLW